MRKGSNSIQSISNRISHGNDAFDRDDDRNRGLGKFYLKNHHFSKLHAEQTTLKQISRAGKGGKRTNKTVAHVSNPNS